MAASLESSGCRLQQKKLLLAGVRGVCLSNCRESANANVSRNKTMNLFRPVHSCLRAKCRAVLVFWFMTAHVNTPPPKSQNSQGKLSLLSKAPSGACHCGCTPASQASLNRFSGGAGFAGSKRYSVSLRRLAEGHCCQRRACGISAEVWKQRTRATNFTS